MTGARHVLLTGSTTPVGRAIAQELLGTQCAESVLCAYGPDEPEPLHTPPRVTYVRIDLTRSREIRDLLFDDRKPVIDTIVHTPLHRDPRDSGQRVFERNVESTRMLLDAAEEQPSIARFILRSHADIYRIESNEPSLLTENHPLDFSPGAAQSVRNRAEADLLTCARMGTSRLHLAVLRCAEILAQQCGSRLFDYLSSRVCIRPLGFDPMLNLLSLRDAARAVALAIAGDARGIFNIPGKDTLPLSELIHCCRRIGLVLPGPLLTPLYDLRARVTLGRFRYAIDQKRLHYTGILDGTRAQQAFGYHAEHALAFATLFATTESAASSSLHGH